MKMGMESMKPAWQRLLSLVLIGAIFGSTAGLSASAAEAKNAPKKQSKKRTARRPASARPSGPQSLTTKQERVDRAVDQMAASSRETAILNLKRMLKLKRGTSEEPMLLWRLADMEWRSSKSYFRVGVSGTQGDGKRSGLRFNQLLESCVAHTTEILTRFPKFRGIRDVLIRRGRAFEELKRKDYALKDYLDYIARYPDEKQTVEVRLMASDVLAEQSRHQDILNILKPVNVSKNLGGLEALVVEKQALANFNVENYPQALRKAEWLLRYDRARGLDKESGGHYDEVIGMLALFYGTAFEKRLAGYSLEHAMDYFRKLEGGRITGKLSHEFMMVMRSKEMQAETFAWKTLALERMPRSFDTLWILVDTYDAVINWKDFPRFAGIEKDFDAFFDRNPAFVAKAHETEWYKKFKRTLLEFADKIYATLPKKDANENDYKVIQAPYLQALNAYMRIADPRDEVKARVRFRIGEFYSSVKDWDRAQQAFTEVYQGKLFVVKETELRDQARIRAMTARYDAFKEKGVIPQDLKAAKLTTAKKPLPSDVIEWIKWVDEVAALAPTGQKAQQEEMVQTMDKLLFEANRVIYSKSDIDLAYKRMLNYVGTRPNSKLTPAVCALVIDTLIESEAWVATRTLAIKFQQMPNVSVGEFKKKLATLERDSHYKITVGVMESKDFARAKAFGDEHLKLYPDSKYKVEILSMMGKISLELKDTESSLAYMNQVIEIAPNHDSVGVAYFVRASDAEKKFLFKPAFDDYLKVYKLPAEKRGISDGDLPALKRKLFLLGLVADDAKTTELLTKNAEFCGSDKPGILRVECERLAALQMMGNEKDRRTAWALVDLGNKAPREAKATWYAAALTRGYQLPNSVVATTIDEMMKSFDKLDTMTQMEVLASLPESGERLFQRKTDTVENYSPISKRLDDLQPTLQKRVREVQGLEKLAVSLMTLPSPELKVRVLGILSKAYAKIADQLQTMPVPRGFKAEEAEEFKKAIASMVDPLGQKVAQLGQQTWEIAIQAGIPSPYWDAATEQNFAASYAGFDGKWQPRTAYLDGLSDAGKKSPWAESVRRKKARPMIFFYQVSQTPQAEKLGLDESDKALLQLATLRAMGLESEANHLLKEKEPTLKGEALRLGKLTQVYEGIVSRSIEGTRVAYKAFRSSRFSDRNRDEAKVLKVAEKIEDAVVEVMAKNEAEAKAKQKAEAQAKAEDAKKRTPAAADQPGADAVPEAK